MKFNNLIASQLGLIGLSVSSLAAIAAPEVHFDQCQQPFSYMSNSYLGTTDRNNNGGQWCYLKSPINGSNWGNVRAETIPQQKTITGKSCATVSNYVLENFHGCTTRNHSTYWCYTDESGNEWEDCQVDSNNSDMLVHTQPQQSDLIERVAIGSCFKVQGTMGQTLDRLITNKPDLFMWLGDNIYADTTNMSNMRGKYDAKKQNEDYRNFLAAEVPVLATWDDHDYGANNAGDNYSKREESQQEFLRHFDIPADDPRYQGQEGVYSAIIQGPTDKSVHSIMLDARYFRTPTFSSYGNCRGEQSSILGEAQWQWLQQELNKPSEVKIIGSGIQFLPPLYLGRNLSSYCAYGDGQAFNQAIDNLEENDLSGTSYESWAEMPAERERLLRLVQQSVNAGKTKQVIFVSGDQHWGELLEKTIPASNAHGEAVKVYEVTASGFGQNWPYDVPNPNRLTIWADNKGDNNYNTACQMPFSYGGISYDSCTTRDHDQPWCYTNQDTKAWGNCAPEGASIPTGTVGKVPSNLSDVSTGDRHLINRSGSNYGQIDIDWQNRQIKLSIQTETEEITSTYIGF